MSWFAFVRPKFKKNYLYTYLLTYIPQPVLLVIMSNMEEEIFQMPFCSKEAVERAGFN